MNTLLILIYGIPVWPILTRSWRLLQNQISRIGQRSVIVIVVCGVNFINYLIPGGGRLLTNYHGCLANILHVTYSVPYCVVWGVRDT